ncbi:hypothetical protein HMPREF1863_01492 [Aedoeadaptatus coxii]|uniref:Uncharacterized protein n=1 Tax=Aedoeadaptatus coxii TaxID=755172 RepID=A0A134AB98_9FIRM|nr:hypothetical protein HMPREF1863_01492 [Peptoniphilus coxii]
MDSDGQSVFKSGGKFYAEDDEDDIPRPINPFALQRGRIMKLLFQAYSALK